MLNCHPKEKPCSISNLKTKNFQRAMDTVQSLTGEAEHIWVLSSLSAVSAKRN